MDSSVSPKNEIWFLRVCHHISTVLLLRGLLVVLVRILARYSVTSTATFMTSSLPVVRTVRGEVAHTITNTVGFLSCCLAETLPHLSKYISICMTSLRVTKCSDPLMVAARIFTGCLKLHSTLQYSLCVRACCVCEIVHNWVLLYTVSSVHVTKCPVPSWRITLLRSVRPHLTVTCASKSERLRTYVL